MIYFSSPIFSQYHQNAPKWCKSLVQNAINRLMPDRLISHKGPSTLQITLTEQAEEKRWIVHLLHYIPERRGADFDIIEDVIPLYKVPISLKSAGEVKSVSCVPQGDSLDFTSDNGRVEITVPEINGHQMLAIELL